MKSVKVSIGMPVYNGADFISQAIDSLLAQTHQDFELIISDNGSTDDTKEICLSRAVKDSRIKFSQNETNLGGLKNFTKVLDLATADYFMWAAHDDVWEPEYIKTLVAIMENDPEVIIAFVMFDAIDELNQMLVEYPTILAIPNDDLYQRLANYIQQHERLGKANPFYSLMRRECTKQAFATAYRFLESGVWASDMLFIFQMLILGKFTVAPQKLFHKRIISNNPNASAPEDWQSYFNGYEALIKQSEVLNKEQKNKLLNDVFRRRMLEQIKYPISILKQIKSHSVQRIKSTIKAFV
jgi:glycosyltransferase involved in cell wall biosynthesis